jgi:hypothetical protein
MGGLILGLRYEFCRQVCSQPVYTLIAWMNRVVSHIVRTLAMTSAAMLRPVAPPNTRNGFPTLMLLTYWRNS